MYTNKYVIKFINEKIINAGAINEKPNIFLIIIKIIVINFFIEKDVQSSKYTLIPVKSKFKIRSFIKKLFIKLRKINQFKKNNS